jgi:hypothetical protein
MFAEAIPIRSNEDFIGACFDADSDAPYLAKRAPCVIFNGF